MIVGIGTDIVNVGRIKRIIDGRSKFFLSLIFTPQEIKYCQSKKSPWVHFAGRFAAKESVFKVLKTKGGLSIRWKEVEILRSKNGEPEISLQGKTKLITEKKGIKRILLSISHNQEYATATAIGEGI